MASSRSRRRIGRSAAIILAVVSVLVAAVVGAWLVVKPEPVADAVLLNAAAASSAALVQSARGVVELSRVSEQKSRTVAFLGDSYNGGSGATAKDRRWTTVLASEAGWVEDNYGVGGTGYANRNQETGKPAYYEQAANIAASGDAVIVVSGGRNDVVEWRTDPVGTANLISETFLLLRAGAPNARIVASNPWWDDDKAPAELQAINGAVEAAVLSIAGTYIDTGQPLFGHPELISEDGIHPNDAGHAVLAAAMRAAVG